MCFHLLFYVSCVFHLFFFFYVMCFPFTVFPSCFPVNVSCHVFPCTVVIVMSFPLTVFDYYMLIPHYVSVIIFSTIFYYHWFLYNICFSFYQSAILCVFLVIIYSFLYKHIITLQTLFYLLIVLLWILLFSLDCCIINIALTCYELANIEND